MFTLRNAMLIKLKGKTSIIFIAIIQNFTPNTIISEFLKVSFIKVLT